MRVVLCAMALFTGGVWFAVPNLSRRRFLFAVPVPDGFRESDAGRQAIARFRSVIAIVILAAICTLLLLPEQLAAAPLITISVAGVVTFYWQHRRLKTMAVQLEQAPREVDLSGQPERLPWFAWLGAGPIAVLIAAAAFLYLNWHRIPARFPVHFGADGQPNRWVDRTFRTVYGWLIYGVELCAFLLVMALACWYGARRSRTRPATLGLLISLEYLFGIEFAFVALNPLLNLPVWMFILTPCAIIIPSLIVYAGKLNEPGENPDPTPEECWRGGILYYNPNDAALFVEKRDGMGFTFNFANRWSWAFPLCLGALVASAFVLLA